ncbi:TPA: phage virion morphogenesis protein [Escherichia coli]|uniref:phage virion morphogenesis protein n=2 Tax=Escherichia coli TaxID=562 RepID=UPI0005A72596|nr:phage virion morphogenesis protein [Escherichia coli]EEV5854472.1 phage virion morphogenesis protein [Escherichia coli]EEW3183160.1 phage virion morphogenesis protein [Escherichia coli]EEZ8366234.1 phage virion morphogenesis protein [Escherichia coli]EFA3442094.1 phage virion morphogenesis protein [Escherichia coli]EFB2338953.1 phage virion morphogenesis protein [Escherichia coli]
MNEFKRFEDRLTGLIESLSPSGRRRVAVDVAKKLRQRQQQRIKLQKAPDGMPYVPRKKQPVRNKKGRIKREMFMKLRTNRFMKATGSESAAVVEFASGVQRIARVHQYGLKDRPNPNVKPIKYDERKLLGFSHNDIDFIESTIINCLLEKSRE